MADAEGEEPDLVKARINWFRRHPFWSKVIFAAGVLAVILGLWKNIFNETIGQSLMRVPALFASEETLADCLDAATTAREKIECHRNH